MRAHARNFSGGHVFHHQNPLPTAPMTRRLTLTLLAALPALLAPAGAQAAKPVGPKLTITERLCNRGADPSERSIVLTVNAALPTASTAVQMRFTVQRRATKKGRWSTVPATPDSGLGIWSASTPGATLLSWTKTIDGLDEGQQYRTRIDARGINDAGAATTRVRRAYVTCIQPQISAKITLKSVSSSVGATTDGGAGGDTPAAAPAQPSIELRNSGRQASGPLRVTLTDLANGTEVWKTTIAGIPGGKKRTVSLNTRGCTGAMRVTVQPVADIATGDTSRLVSGVVGCTVE